jgi:hypothetical protein
MDRRHLLVGATVGKDTALAEGAKVRKRAARGVRRVRRVVTRRGGGQLDR